MSRDRSIDGLRAYAITGVVLGHWLVTGLVLTPDGALHQASPLAAMPALIPVTWVLQTLGLFFFAGGYASARSLASATGHTSARSPATGHTSARLLSSATGRGVGPQDPGGAAHSGPAGGYRSWLRRRFGGLARQAGVLLGCGAAVLAVAVVTGTPATTLRTIATLLVSPLWFLLPFAALVALTGPLRRVMDRWGVTAVALTAAAPVAAADLIGRGSPTGVPGWLVPPTVLGAWLVPYLLGMALAAGRLGPRRTGAALAAGRPDTRRAGWALALAGAAAMAGLVLVGGYPASAVGVPGAGRSNLNPPSLLAVCLAVAQVGCALLLRPGLARLLERPRWWAPVAGLNRVAARVYLWHQPVLVGVTGLAALGVRFSGGGAVPGLHSAPDGPGWVLARLGWLPVFAAVLALLVVGTDHPPGATQPLGHGTARPSGRGSPVEHQVGADGVAGVGRGQVEHRGGDLVEAADPADR